MSAGRADGPLSIDIVIDNYDYARFLPAAIDSALAQTYPHVTVIVVDDGSRDGSREIIMSYGDRVIPVFKENGGQASAFNAGLARSRGDVVFLLDSDDVLHAEAASRVVEAFRERPALARVHGRMDVIDADGRPLGRVKPDAHLPLPSGDLRLTTLRSAFDLTWLPTSANAFAGSVLRRICPMLEQEYRSGADSYLVHVSSLFGEVGALDAILASYRVHGANAYEQSVHELDLAHVRESIRLAETTRPQLERWARELGLAGEPAALVAFSEVGNRAISLRLDPAGHPLRGDSRSTLLRLGWAAARRRSDVGWPLRVLLVGWLTAFLVSPRPLARALAEQFLFPQRRRGLNRLLGVLHRLPLGQARPRPGSAGTGVR